MQWARICAQGHTIHSNASPHFKHAQPDSSTPTHEHHVLSQRPPTPHTPVRVRTPHSERRSCANHVQPWPRALRPGMYARQVRTHIHHGARSVDPRCTKHTRARTRTGSVPTCTQRGLHSLEARGRRCRIHTHKACHPRAHCRSCAHPRHARTHRICSAVRTARDGGHGHVHRHRDQANTTAHAVYAPSHPLVSHQHLHHQLTNQWVCTSTTRLRHTAEGIKGMRSPSPRSLVRVCTDG